MNEVKAPKKPLLCYYIAVLLAVMLFNFLAMLWPVDLSDLKGREAILKVHANRIKIAE